jgi:hypothetical protein
MYVPTNATRHSLSWVLAWGIVCSAIAAPAAASSLSEQPNLRPIIAIPIKDVVVQAVGAWLDCDRCAQGELARLQRFGDVSVPLLEEAAAKGPSSAAVEMLRRHLVATFFVLERARSTETWELPTIGLTDFVDRYLAAQSTRVRLRAIAALKSLDGSAAAAAAIERLRIGTDGLPEKISGDGSKAAGGTTETLRTRKSKF